MTDHLTAEQIENINTFLFTCGSGGGDCAGAFQPMVGITMPSVGLPNVNINIPDFGGLTIEVIVKALELLGIDPCAFIGAILGAVSDFVTDFNSALQNSVDQIAQLPADVINGIAGEVQNNLDSLIGPDLQALIDAGDPCQTLTSQLNDTVAQAAQNASDIYDINNPPPPTP